MVQILEFLKKTFLRPRPQNIDDFALENHLNINFNIVVAEFLDVVESTGGETIASLLKMFDGISVNYYNKPFDKSFLNLESRTLFDLVDKGQSILDDTSADVLIWGCREGNKIRLNFQTSSQYEAPNDSFVTLMDSLYFPASFFANASSFTAPLLNLLYGAIIASINTEDKTKQIQKKYLLKKIIAKLSSDNSSKSISFEYMPYVMNFLGLIYLSYCAKSETDQDFKIVKNLFDTALGHKDAIKNPLHLGCLYAHLGQLYSCISQSKSKRPINSYRNAIYNYQLAQKYFGKYTYPYEYGLISYQLSSLFYNYWKQKEDLQALRDSVFHLREAEKIFTYALFPDLWSQIEGNLGYYLSLLSQTTSSYEIAELAIAAYKNQQKIITEKRDPLLWAKIQENIGDIYYRLGKKSADRVYFEEALEYYHDALYIFENMSFSKDSQRLTNSIAKTNQALTYH